MILVRFLHVTFYSKVCKEYNYCICVSKDVYSFWPSLKPPNYSVVLDHARNPPGIPMGTITERSPPPHLIFALANAFAICPLAIGI